MLTLFYPYDSVVETSLTKWKGTGIRYLDENGDTTAEWSSLKSVGEIPTGVTGRYQQIEGGETSDFINEGAINQVVQIYGDSNHGNIDYDTYLIVKFNPNGYTQARVDVMSFLELTELEPYEYIIPINAVALDAAAGDPDISITLIDHSLNPLLVEGKYFDYEIQDNGVNSGEDILREWNYNLSLSAEYQGFPSFNLGTFIVEYSEKYATELSYVEGQDTPTTTHGVYVSRAGAYHPDFARFQSNDGTYYVTPRIFTAQNVLENSRVQLFETDEKTNDIYDSSWSYKDANNEIETDDTVRLRVTYVNGVTAKLALEMNLIASESGGSFLVEQEDDEVYNTNAIDGSTVTGITIDDSTDTVSMDITGGTVSWAEIYAYFVWWTNTEEGIRDDLVFMNAPDTANYIVTNFKIKNTSSPEVPLIITGGYGVDSVTGSSSTLMDTSGGSLFFAPDHVVPYAIGSGLTDEQDATLTANNTAILYVQTKVDTLPDDILDEPSQ